jgi:hypothetical protein
MQAYLQLHHTAAVVTVEQACKHMVTLGGGTVPLACSPVPVKLGQTVIGQVNTS